MKGKILNRAGIAVGIALTLTVNGLAGPLRSGDVAQNPAWVAHVDCDSLRSNVVGKFLLAEMDKPENQPKISAVSAIFGVDLRTQIHGVTVYASGNAMQQPVLLIYGEFDTNRLGTLVKGALEYDGMQHGPWAIHSWLDEKKKTADGSHPRVYAAFLGSGLIVFSPGRSAVAEALDVLDKKADNLAANDSYSKLLKCPDEKIFLQAAAPKIILPATAHRNPILDLTTHVRLSLRAAADNRIAGVLNIGGKDEQVVRNMVSIAQGITGLARIQHEDPKLSSLAEKVIVKQDWAELSATFSATPEEVIDFLKLAAAGKRKR